MFEFSFSMYLSCNYRGRLEKVYLTTFLFFMVRGEQAELFFFRPLKDIKLFPHFPLSHPENPPKLYHRNNDIVALSPELDDNHFWAL